LFFTNLSRLNQFENDYNTNALAFVESETIRAQNTLKEYQNVVFTSIPIILAVCSIALLFFSTPVWRASLITTIALLVVILLIDGTAYGRMESYYKKLQEVKVNKKDL
jgi:hypothetical protein